MKNIYYILITSVALLFSACSDWLDVRPRNEMKEDALYANEEGFKNALNGVYILLAKENLYGKNATMYIPEMLTRHWILPVNSTSLDYRLANLDYTNSSVENLFESLWSDYYTVIVHLNNILTNIENNEVKFSYGNDRLIKGEALGLRAFLHLDLLRLFGPVPGEDAMGKPAIPYVEEMTKDVLKLQTKTYDEVCKRIERDLDAAEAELEKDPIILNKTYDLNHPSEATGEDMPEDSWQYYRQIRFNYYAVKGTKARFYHWLGDTENAVKYAKEVVKALNPDGTSKFELTTDGTLNLNTLVFLNEHLFGVYNSDLKTFAQPLFENENPTFTQSVTNIDAAFEVSEHPLDIRYKKDENRYWKEKQYQNSTKYNHYMKYTGNDDYDYANTVPLLRLAEMYLILIEDLPLAEAHSYFSTYRLSRALDLSVENTLNSANDVRLRLEKECRKEFFGEGQMFFFYKKHRYESYSWPATYALPANAYQIPLPKSQTIFD